MNDTANGGAASTRTPTESLHAYALAAHAAGLCVVPPKQDGSKMPIGKEYVDELGQKQYGWTPWQSERSTLDELRDWYERARKTGVGFVCGKVSGGLEMFEFEHRETRDAFVAVAEQLGMGELVARIRTGYESDTPGGGVHWLYRCSEIAGNTKLACRPKRPDEMTGPKDKVQVLIETRGEHGYTVEAPSNGRVHPTGGVYRLVSGSVATIVTIAPAERQALFDLAPTFDEMPENAPRATPEPDVSGVEFEVARNTTGLDVVDDFNRRAEWRPLLEAEGWTYAGSRGVVEYYRRPGKDRNHSATVNFGGADRLCVFSSSTDLKVTGGRGSKAGYSKFGFYAEVKHGNDSKAAVRDLARQGYGPTDKVVGRFKLNGKTHTTYADGRVVTTPVEPPPPNGSAHSEEPEAASPRSEEPRTEPAATTSIALKQTEMGLSELLVHRHGRDLRYCFPWACFLTWDGRRFQRDRTGEARRRAKETIRSVYAIAAKTEDDKQRRGLLDWIKPFEKANKVAAILTLAEVEPGIPIVPEEMDADPFLFNVANGTVDLRTGRLKPHDRADALTKLAPVWHDEAATCPTFLAFLERVLPDAEVRDFLRRFVGYCLTGNTSEQCLCFLYGGGANGKSTFLNVFLALLGDYGKQAAPELLTHKSSDRHPTELADIFGARLVTSVEVDEGKRLAETLVKQMTGGDRMKARFMRGDFFEWTPTHKLFLAANHRPAIRGTDYAIWRRIHLVPFEVTIPKEERDGQLTNKLLAELPGILNWAIAGCLEWQRNGLGIPEAVQDATAHYRAEQDVLGEFLSERCIKDAQAFVATAALYKAYTTWCEDGGEKPVNKTAFGRGLTERGFVQGRTKSGRFWQGLRLRGADEPFAGDAFADGDAFGRDFPYSSSNSAYEDDNRKNASNASPGENASPGDDEQSPLVSCFGCGGVVDTGETMCSACSEVTA